MDYEKMMELMKSISYKRKHGEPLNSEEMDFMMETYKSLCPLDYELMCFEFVVHCWNIVGYVESDTENDINVSWRIAGKARW